MPCSPDALKGVPLFALLDEEETAVLASQVELKQFHAHQRIYKIGDPGGRAYVLISGHVHVTTIDDDQQEVVVSEPAPGDFFGFASMIEETVHQTGAAALSGAVCIEVDRDDIATLIQRKPLAGMDMLTVLARQIHQAQELVRTRSVRNPNEVIEEETTFGQRLADHVAHFGGSWSFIIAFAMVLIVYAAVNVELAGRAWDPYPFILLNLFLSMLASVQAPLIMMSQNRQDIKDRLRSEMDFDVNCRAELEIQGLARKLNGLDEKLADIDEALREMSGRNSA